MSATKEKLHDVIEKGMKQTAVEWLEFRYKNNINLTQGDFEQAKEMEKQQQDEFAIGFAEWCLTIRFEPIENVSVEKLLEIYKKDNL
jgi:hypothetical protein